MSDPAESTGPDLHATLLAMDPLVGKTIDGRYIVEGVLGEGGMGLVYRARHSVLNKTLAVKVLRPEVSNNPLVIARFRQEAQSATAIGNQHIIEVFDFGVLPDGATYFVMEYLDGSPLTRVIERDAPLPIGRVVHVARQLGAALQAAHGAGIVHRDLKPDNIFLVRRGKDPDFVKVLDFGIAKVGGSSSKLTQAGQVFGTPHYMSPEQCQGHSVDHRADIYSLGIILFELVTGRLPFEAGTAMGLLAAHLTEAPPLPSTVRADCPPGLDTIILRCLEKNPEHRYPSCADLIRDLDAFAAGHEIPRWSRVSGIVESVRPSAPASLAPPRSSSAPTAAAQSSRNVVILGVAFGLLGLGGIGVGVFALVGRTPAEAVAPPPTIPSIAPLAVQGGPTEAAPRMIHIVSVPAGAEVLSDGLLLGNTPLVLPLPVSGERRDLLLRLAGHEDKAVTISSGTLADELRFELQPAARTRSSSHGSAAGAGTQPVSAPSAPQTPPPAESTQDEPRPRRRTSDVINPWAN